MFQKHRHSARKLFHFMVFLAICKSCGAVSVGSFLSCRQPHTLPPSNNRFWITDNALSEYGKARSLHCLTSSQIFYCSQGLWLSWVQFNIVHCASRPPTSPAHPVNFPPRHKHNTWLWPTQRQQQLLVALHDSGPPDIFSLGGWSPVTFLFSCIQLLLLLQASDMNSSRPSRALLPHPTCCVSGGPFQPALGSVNLRDFTVLFLRCFPSRCFLCSFWVFWMESLLVYHLFLHSFLWICLSVLLHFYFTKIFQDTVLVLYSFTYCVVLWTF